MNSIYQAAAAIFYRIFPENFLSSFVKYLNDHHMTVKGYSILNFCNIVEFLGNL